MSRPKSSGLTLSVACFALLIAIGFAVPALADNSHLTLQPTSLNFGNVDVGTTGASQTVTATNVKNPQINFTSITASASFTVTSNHCTTLLSGKMCNVAAACKPTALGPVSGTLTFAYTFGPDKEDSGTSTVGLKCTGVKAVTGDVLIAGGDVGGLLGKVVPLATNTNSTTASEVYETLADSFATVGPLNGSREGTAYAGNAYAAVALPNGKTLIAGGENCFAQTINSTNGGPACGTRSFAGFECDAINTAELFNKANGLFSPAGTAFGANPMGAMTAARSFASATLLADGTVLLAGGSSGSSFLALTAPPTGCGPAGQVSENTAEIYNPATDTFTATASIPACAPGTGPGACGLPATCPVNGTVAIAASPTGATESVNTVTITTTTANGFLAGQTVTISGVGGATSGGYNGTFVIASTPTTTTFTYTDSVPNLAASGGGAATSVVPPFVRACGLVDPASALLGNGTALVAGGDYLQFLAQSSPQSFVYVPSYDSPGPNPPAGTPFWVQTFPLNFPRELAGITNLSSGKVLIEGGVLGLAALCIPTPSTPVQITTNQTAEVFDPATNMWTLTGLMSVPRVATVETFTSGPDNGKAITAGGVDLETPGFTGDATGCVATTSITQSTTGETDLFDPGTSKFTPTGTMIQDREGYAATILNTGAHAGDLAVFGGACAKNGTLVSVVIGTPIVKGVCDGGKGAAPNNYYEFFDPGTAMWTAGTGSQPAVPSNTPAFALQP